MDGSHFDTLVRALATTRLTRVQTLRGLVAGVVASLTGLSLFAEAGAKGKGKGKKTRRRRRKNKKKLVCTCSTTGCTQQKVKNASALINQNPRCNYGGGCTTNPCAATVPPPLACLPEPQATTCAAGCGQRLNNCNQPVSCPCPSGQTCLPNGTCARPCTLGGMECGGCTQSRTCATTSEGQSICIVIPSVCGTLQPCPVTTSCPQGSACIACGMAGLRCVQVGICP